MNKEIEINAGQALTTIVLKDNNGNDIGTAKINLFDIRLVSRHREISDFFKTYTFDATDPASVAELDEALADKFCFMLGYDCRASLFGVLSPTTILPNGELLAMEIIERIGEQFTEDVKERAEARAQLIGKYVDRYKK